VETNKVPDDDDDVLRTPRSYCLLSRRPTEHGPKIAATDSVPICRTTDGGDSANVERKEREVGADAPAARARWRHVDAESFACRACERAFSRDRGGRDERRAGRGLRGPDRLSCAVCPTAFTLRSELMVHARTYHANMSHRCPTCRQRFSRRGTMAAHTDSHRRMYNAHRRRRDQLRRLEEETLA